MGNTKQTAREILEKEFSNCPEAAVIDLSEILTHDCGIIALKRNAIPVKTVEGHNVSKIVEVYRKGQVADDLAILLDDIIGEDGMRQITEYAAKLDTIAQEDEKAEYTRARVVDYYTTNHLTAHEKFEQKLQDTNAKILVLHNTRNAESVSPRTVLENILTNTLGVFYDQYRIVDFHFYHGVKSLHRRIRRMVRHHDWTG